MPTLANAPAVASSTYTLRVPQPLKAAFEQVASLHERSGAQVLREYMRSYVQANAQQALSHEAWFAAQVEATRGKLARGEQGSASAESVHAWLASWGTAEETEQPKADAPRNAASKS